MRRGYFTPPVLIILALITLGVALTLYFNTSLLRNIKNKPTPSPTINSFEDCVRAGNRILLTDPRQCKTPDGKSFTEIIDGTANWKTLDDKNYSFEFKYPREWRLSHQDGARILFLENEDKMKIISIDTQVDLRIVGNLYCGTVLDKARCETLNNSNIPVIIDWGIGGEAWVLLTRSNQSAVSLTLHEVNSETKPIFRQILSTFKFLD